MTNQEYRAKYGEEAYQKKLAAFRDWHKAHPNYYKEHRIVYKKNINRSRPYMDRYKLAHPQCECCFNPTEEIHHIIPIPNDRLLDFGDPLLIEDNLMALCKDCHNKIHAEMNKRGDEDAGQEL